MKRGGVPHSEAKRDGPYQTMKSRYIRSSNGDDDSTPLPNLTSTARILSYNNNSTRTDNTELDGAVSGLEVTYVHTKVPGNTPSFYSITLSQFFFTPSPTARKATKKKDQASHQLETALYERHSSTP